MALPLPAPPFVGRVCARQVADLLHSWDSSGDGLVDLGEFTSKLLELGLEEQAEGEHERLFDSLDSDGNRTLDLNELSTALKRLQRAAAAHIAEEDTQEAVVDELYKAAKAAQAAGLHAAAAAQTAWDEVAAAAGAQPPSPPPPGKHDARDALGKSPKAQRTPPQQPTKLASRSALPAPIVV